MSYISCITKARQPFIGVDGGAWKDPHSPFCGCLTMPTSCLAPASTLSGREHGAFTRNLRRAKKKPWYSSRALIIARPPAPGRAEEKVGA